MTPVLTPCAPLLLRDHAVSRAIGPRTRFAVFDHVTSNTALVLPVERLTKLCREKGVRVLIDGAHAPGMLSLDLSAIGADYYVANLHKWYVMPRNPIGVRFVDTLHRFCVAKLHIIFVLGAMHLLSCSLGTPCAA
jgi:selenocysteine lyase/cysteine desulfurase